MSNPGSGRVRAFDWLRGLAVVFMVECHALVLLRPELRQGAFFARVNFLNGLVAPSFIFAAGFSLGLVQVRGAQGPRMKRVWKTLRRLAEVLGVGTLINVIWFPIRVEPWWLFRVDILQCIGLSLLLALPLLALLARHPRRLAASTLLLAAVSFAIAPFFEHLQGPLAALANANGRTHSVFPLLPWAGYVFLGASVGAMAASESARVVKLFLLGLSAVGAVLWALAATFVRLYPPHTFWVSDPANHGERWTLVCGALVGLLVLEERLSARFKEGAAFRFLVTLGTSSLAAYFYHEMLIYFRVFGAGVANTWRDQLAWGPFLFAVALLVAATTALAKLTDLLYPRWDALFTGPQRTPPPDGPAASPPPLLPGPRP